MLAVLASDELDTFYQIISSFPTAIYTSLVLLCVLIWLISFLGLIDLEFLDVDMPEADADLSADGGFEGGSLFSAFLVKFGLNGVPVVVILSIISIIGWLICYYVVYFLFSYIPGQTLKYVVGVPTFLGCFFVSAWITSFVIKPIRGVFTAAVREVEVNLIGKVAIVRTGEVTKDFGEAEINENGAHLIVKVRSFDDKVFSRGDRVVLPEFLDVENTYRVVSESEFKG